MKTPWRSRIGVLVLLLLTGCHTEARYATPAPAPLPPPPSEPPPGAPRVTSVDGEPTPPPEAPPGAPPEAPPGEPSAAAPAQAQTSTAPLPPLPTQAPVYGAAPSTQTAPAPAPYTPSTEAPPSTQWVRQYPEGQWVYTTDYGWIWIPAGTTATVVEGVPYAYIYTPRVGWTWYVSPWGWGPYRYGVWVSRPYRPYGWRYGFVARPHVVVRLGRRHR